MNKTEFLDFKKEFLDEFIESRIRYLMLTAVWNIQVNWALEYFFENGLRTGDIIVNIADTPWVQIQISDLESNEPLHQLLDY